MGLSPGLLADLLSERLTSITDELEQLRTYAPDIRRIRLIETEHQEALANAEANWLRTTIDELRAGTLTWDHDQIAAQAADTITQAVAA